MKYNIYILFVLVLCACTSRQNEAMYFSEYKSLGKDYDGNEIILIDSLFEYKNDFLYKFEFNCWYGIEVGKKYIPEVSPLKGYLLLKPNEVFFKKDINSRDQFKIFDFNMQKGEAFINTYNNREFEVELKDKAFVNNDSIFKFKFKNIARNYNFDLVCYVSKRKGVKGMYLSSYNNRKEIDELIDKTGELYDSKELKKHSEPLL